MTTTMTITDTEISFEKQFNGYDRGQVDRYIASLSGAYQTAYDEYKAVCDKYNSLLEDYKEMKTKEMQRPAADIITKTLVDTESLAHKIISDANTEAERIAYDAQAEAKRITDEAHVEAKRITDDAYTQKAAMKIEAQKILNESATEAEDTKKAAQMIIEHANLAASSTQEKARKVIDYAHIEASQIVTQANKDRRDLNDILKTALENIQSIQARNVTDTFEPAASVQQTVDTPCLFLASSIGEVS